MEYKVIVFDKDIQLTSENTIKVRKGTSLNTVAVKAIEKHVNNSNVYDDIDFMREVNSINRESFEIDDFLDDLESDLDLIISIKLL